jgi:hypothetical protein
MLSVRAMVTLGLQETVSRVPMPARRRIPFINAADARSLISITPRRLAVIVMTMPVKPD